MVLIVVLKLVLLIIIGYIQWISQTLNWMWQHI